MVVCLPDTVISIAGNEDVSYTVTAAADPATKCPVPIQPTFVEKQGTVLREKLTEGQKRYLELKKQISALEEILKQMDTYRTTLRRWAARAKT